MQQTWLCEQVPTVCDGVHSKKKTQEEPLGHPALLALERRELWRELAEDCEEAEEIGVEERELVTLEISELCLEDSALLRRLERALLDAAVQHTSDKEQLPTVCSGVHSKKYTQEESDGQGFTLELERCELALELLVEEVSEDFWLLSAALDAIEEVGEFDALETLERTDAEETKLLLLDVTDERELEPVRHCSAHCVS